MITHRIRRQRWQVTAPDAATAFAMRSLLRRTQDGALRSWWMRCSAGTRRVAVCASSPVLGLRS